MPYKTKEELYEAQRRHRDRNKQKVRDHLLANPCIDCGEADIRVLEFDHVRGKKFKEVGRMVTGSTYSWLKIKEEIDKCDVRCANCHKRKTYAELGFTTYKCNSPS